MKILVTDVDETFAYRGRVSKKNFSALNSLKHKKNVLKVLATGRNLFSLKSIMPLSVPFDYAIFSTGAGVFDWKEQKVLCENYFTEFDKEIIKKSLEKLDLDYFVHDIFGNFYHSFIKQKNDDFERRIDLYKNEIQLLRYLNFEKLKGSQFIIIIPVKDFDKVDSLKNDLPKDLTLIETLSPLDKKSIWVEILPPNINKANSLFWLCNHLKLKDYFTLAIGNDYNDIELLEFADSAYVVGNSPEFLKVMFKSTKSARENGFAEVVKEFV